MRQRVRQLFCSSAVAALAILILNGALNRSATATPATSDEGILTKEWTVEELARCLQNGDTLQVIASDAASASVRVSANESSLQHHLQSDSSTCYIKVKVRHGGQAKVDFPALQRSLCGVASSRDQSVAHAMRGLDECEGAQTAVTLHSNGTSEWFSLQVGVSVDSSDQSLHVNLYGDLAIIFHTPLRGSIQRLNVADLEDRNVLPKKWVRLPVPPNHKTIINLGKNELDMHHPAFTCSFNDYIKIYGPGNYSQAHTLSCMEDVTLPLLYENDKVYLEYPAYRQSQAKQNSWHVFIKLLFAFLPKSSSFKRGPDGRWNCSVEQWGDVRSLFPCNLQVECVRGEDEQGCPYTGVCGSGLISLPTGCYVYVGTQTAAESNSDLPTWEEARRACVKRGGQLASLNTPQEWTAVTELLRDAPHTAETFLGLRKAATSLPHMYRQSYKWLDSTVAHFVTLAFPKSPSSLPEGGRDTPLSAGAYFSKRHLGQGPPSFLPLVSARGMGRRSYLCEVESSGLNSTLTATSTPEPNRGRGSGAASSVARPQAISRMPPTPPSLIACPDQHLTHKELACDVSSDCWVHNGRRHHHGDAYCSVPISSFPLASWQCQCGGKSVPYRQLCDHKADCLDGSDEEFCVFQPCAEFTCTSKPQCIPLAAVCDGQQHCEDGSDEGQCSNPGNNSVQDYPPSENTMIFIDLDPRGFLLPRPWGNNTCPDTHFHCPSHTNLCLPVFLVCNGVSDCPFGEDEKECDTHGYHCPGYFRCQKSLVCVHVSSVCDGKFQCPEGDDERGCNSVCPDSCQCYGSIYTCRGLFNIDQSTGTSLRYLDATGSGTQLGNLSQSNLVMLVHLILAHCRLNRVDTITLPNLLFLDLSFNKLIHVDFLSWRGFPNLRVLSLAYNPLVLPTHLGDLSERRMSAIHTLDLSGVHTLELSRYTFVSLGMTGLQSLNLSFSGLRYVDGALHDLRQLQTLDVRGCPITKVPHDIFQNQEVLEYVYADNYKLCCPSILPGGINLHNCYAPYDEISSCESLLRHNMNRLFLYIYAMLAIVGNVFSLVYRFCDKQQRESSLSCNILVSHLCVSDLLMGVYLVMIGVADFLYRGSYVWNDDEWRHSTGCRAAGFLALLSCEVSALVICLITLDRLLAVRFPLSKLRFKTWSARLACIAVWLVGLALAGIPLLPSLSHWEFYSQTGVSIPLPITRQEFQGRAYSFCILIIFNFLLFLIIAPGQALIYQAVRQHQRASGNNNPSENVELASRLFTIAMTDFMCWFPIGFLGILAAQGCPVPGTLNVVTVIFVLPLNSAINPFLYTLGVHRERLRRQRKCTCDHGNHAETNVDDMQSTAYIHSTLDPV